MRGPHIEVAGPAGGLAAGAGPPSPAGGFGLAWGAVVALLSEAEAAQQRALQAWGRLEERQLREQDILARREEVALRTEEVTRQLAALDAALAGLAQDPSGPAAPAPSPGGGSFSVRGASSSGGGGPGPSRP